jgi:hypothetical protein
MGQSGQVRGDQGGVITCPTFYNVRSANGGNGRYWLERDHPAGLL